MCVRKQITRQQQTTPLKGAPFRWEKNVEKRGKRTWTRTPDHSSPWIHFFGSFLPFWSAEIFFHLFPLASFALPTYNLAPFFCFKLRMMTASPSIGRKREKENTLNFTRLPNNLHFCLLFLFFFHSAECRICRGKKNNNCCLSKSRRVMAVPKTNKNGRGSRWVAGLNSAEREMQLVDSLLHPLSHFLPVHYLSFVLSSSSAYSLFLKEFFLL